ncbi:MAG TPA: cation-efflux pump [Candidatus Omnitrophica bacterium]|uniref:Uncharacterized protein n=1 Tax=Candidatus Kaiserbacteria bacterium GW2011_GWA2_49_19 TaxID=1618669 RepID=A0A0G1VQZ3_9BACT|nr:MAG: hypothetical protein UY44_C0006G0008 [Candidatus Kaiserbacteria bacterium GW2011_GWA2_49_19]HBR15240.1 cation-efflux pump [Candidatus Omnitrophota bacterium]
MKNNSGLEARIKRGLKTAIISLLLNSLLAIIKVATGVLGNCYALIADGIESLTDIFSSTVVYRGIKISSLPPDEKYPFGYGKAESLAALIVSAVLLGAASTISVQSLREIAHPHHPPEPYTLYVLIFVILVKETMFRFFHKTGKEIDSMSIQAEAWHSRSDALTSLAAFIGISAGLIGGPGYENMDDWAALFASGVIFFNGFRILRSAIVELMDAGPSPEIERRIRVIAREVPGVRDVEKCLVRKSGYRYFVEVHLEVEGTISVKEGHDIAHEVKDHLLNAGMSLINVVIHVEPYGQIRSNG